ncbi:MAG: prepilin peptidase [Candidatus Xenobiia bacterium LiM19]
MDLFLKEWLESFQIITDGRSTLGTVFFFMWGCFWGSFINVCIYRLPIGRSIVYPGSSCPHCGQPIAWWANIPILSFLLLKAKCYYCYNSISLRYPSIELVTGLLCAFIFQFAGGFTWEFIYDFVFLNMLIIIFFVDLDHWIILDSITLSGCVFGFVGSLFLRFRPTILVDMYPQLASINTVKWLQWTNMIDSLLGMMVGYLLFMTIAFVGSVMLRQEAMGGGDVKFAALIGAFLGAQSAVIAFVASFFLGFLYAVPMLILRRKKGKDPVPFGTFMALAALITMIWKDDMLTWFMNIQSFFYQQMW